MSLTQRLSFSFVIFPLFLAGSATAAPFLLENLSTGVDSNGNRIAVGSLGQVVDDPFWDVTPPSGPTDDARVTLQATQWVTSGSLPAVGTPPDNPGAAWISTRDDSRTSAPSAPAGTYTYQRQFTVTDPASLFIQGRFWVDNTVNQLLLNGSNVTFTRNTPTATNNHATNNWSSFTIPENLFNSGLNTLSFVVQNGTGASGNPTGLLVQAGLYVSVPELDAASALLPTSILALLAMLIWDRRKRATPAA